MWINFLLGVPLFSVCLSKGQKRQLINMDLSNIQKEVHKIAVDNGFHDGDISFGDFIALCHSELSEALEVYRKYIDIRHIYYGHGKIGKQKPEGVPIELADCIMRILDFCEHNNIDIEEVIIEKMIYNKTRPYRHGDKKI